jgi:hypothetical protein
MEYYDFICTSGWLVWNVNHFSSLERIPRLNLFIRITMETLTRSDNPEAYIPLLPPDLMVRLESVFVQDRLYNTHKAIGWPQAG